MQWPGKLPAGTVSDLPVISTGCDATCVVAGGGKWTRPGNWTAWISLPFLTGSTKGRPHETFYWRIDGMWAVRHGDWKLVHGQAGNGSA